jgi:hypothetical protein
MKPFLCHLLQPLPPFFVLYLGLNQHRPIKIKKHGRPQVSIFRYGLDYLRSIVSDLDLKSDDFLHSLQFLSCT